MSTIIGLLTALVMIGIGMTLKGVSPSALYNPAALLIIFGGTFATLFVAFPLNEIKKLPIYLKIVFTEPKLPSKESVIGMFNEWSILARKEGFLALEDLSDTTDDPFLKTGLEMIIDGEKKEFIEEILLDEIDALQERHKPGSSIFSQAGGAAPTLGVLGAVVGLIASLGNLENVGELGYSISAAFIATLFGVFTGYVIWHPFSNKLKRLSKQEQEIKMMMLVGLLGIQEGLTPAAITKKLSVYLPTNKRLKTGGETIEEEEEVS